MKPEEITTINAIIDHLDDQRRCNCTSAEHEPGCIVPLLLDLHRQANETRHTITILKRDRDVSVAKRLAEEEMLAIYGAYTDHTVNMAERELTELFAHMGLIGYLIRIDANLTDEELTDIRRKQYEREYTALANIGQVMVDDVDIGLSAKEFFK